MELYKLIQANLVKTFTRSFTPVGQGGRAYSFKTFQDDDIEHADRISLLLLPLYAYKRQYYV